MVMISAASIPAKTAATANPTALAFHTAHLLCGFRYISKGTTPPESLRADGLFFSPLPMVYEDLGPANQAQGHKYLRLDLDRQVEILDDRVDAKRGSA